MESEIHDIKKSLARIETAVIGDKQAGIEGLAERMHKAEKYQENDKKLKNKIAGGLFISVPLLTLAWEFTKDWIQKHF